MDIYGGIYLPGSYSINIGIEKRLNTWRFARFLGNHLAFEKSPLLWHISEYPMSQDSLYEFSVYHHE